MELNKILQSISPVGMSEGDKVIIEIIKGVATIRFEPAKNENFLDDMIEDDCEELEDEDLVDKVDEEEDEEYVLEYEGCDDCDKDCEHCKECEKDIKIATMLQKTLEDLKNIMKS